MAGRNIGATLSLNNGNFFTNMKSAINSSNNLKNTLNGTTTGIKKFGSQTFTTGGIITSLASKAAVAVSAFVGIRQAINFGKDIINTGVEFEQGMANVSAISGATGAELMALSEKAKEMGATTKYSAIEASDAMSYMAMAGWNSSQMIDGIAGIMNLAAASGEELASVSDIVTDSLTAFGLKASDSAEFADILAVASSKSNTNVSMLGESFKNVAPVAGAMGYSVRDTTVALGLMANAGIKGSDAGTSLRGVMTRLAKPTKEVSVALDALNISVVNADGSMKPLSTLIPELQSKFAGLTDEERGQYATMIAGKNAMSGFLSIVSSSPSDFQALSDAIYNSEGAAQSMADTMNDTVSGKLTLLKSQFEGVKIAIFDALGSSQFKGVLQSMSDGLGAITPAVSAITIAIGNGLFGAVNSIYGIAMTVFNAVKSAIDNNTPAVDNLKTSVDNVKTSIMDAFSGNSEQTIQNLANVVVPTLANAFAGVLNVVSGVTTFISSNWNIIAPIIAGVTTAVIAYKAAVIGCTVAENAINIALGIKNAITMSSGAIMAAYTAAHWALSAGYGVATAAQWALNAAMTANPVGVIIVAIGALVAIGVALYKNWDTIKAKALELWNNMKNVFNGIKDAISNAWNGVKEKASAAWDGIKSAVSEKVEGIKSAVSEKFNAVKNVMGNIMDGAKSIVSNKLNNIKNAYNEHGGGIKGIAAGYMTALKEYYTTGYDAINALTGGKLGQVVDSVKSKLAPMVNTIKEKLSGIKDAFANAFSNAINFIKNSYNEGALKPVVDKVIAVFGNIKTAIAEKFNGIKEAVSEKVAVVAEAVIGIKDKIAEKFNAVKTAVAEKFTGIKEAVSVKLTAVGEAASGIKDKIAEKFTTVKDAIVQKFTGIKDGVISILAPLGEAVGSIVTGIKTVISTIIDGIRSYITNTVQNIQTTVISIVNSIKQNFATFFTSIQAAFQNIWNGITSVFEGIKTVIVGAFQFIVGIFTFNIDTIKNSVQTIKDGFFTAFEGAKQIVTNVWTIITSTASLVWNNITAVVSGAINGVKAQVSTVTGTVSSVFSSVWNTISNTFQNVYSKVVSVFDNVKSTISNAISTIKGYFNFSWSLPKIKLPHFKINGSFNLNPPSAPSFGVEWYKKGGIMTRPTMFGMNGRNAMVGGEAGAEAILPLDMLWSKLAQILNNQNSTTKSETNNNINVTVYADSDDAYKLANTVAGIIVEKIENM